MARPIITITVSGPRSAGKTAIMVMLARALREGMIDARYEPVAPEAAERSIDSITRADPIVAIKEAQT